MTTSKCFFRKVLFSLLILFFSSNGFAQVEQLQLEKIQRALQFIKFAYIEELDDEKLIEDAIRGVLKNLDPHSRYLSADELREDEERLEGSFDGIGIQFDIINDSIIVVSPIPGGPSERVGLMPGDKIVYIDQETAHGSHITNEFVQERLRGKRGSEVEVVVYRAGHDELLDFVITRDRIPIYSVDASFMATETIGYIKINRFARTTLNEFREALNKLKAQGMQELIIDLNYNSGGYLDVGIGLTDEFLDRGHLIVYTEGNAAPKQEFKSTFRGNFLEGKVVVLINEGSASSSEIFAGAIQDWDRGLIIGRRSFGKGLVQRPFELPDGSAIRLTTAQYHTPTGRSIQKPYDQGADQYAQDLNERLSSGELISPDNISFPDSLKYYTKINNRVVYGGGGIMPDFFIPLDTTTVATYYSRMLRRGVINTFCIEYTNRHRNELAAKHPDIQAFIQGFISDDDLLEKLHAYAEEHYDISRTSTLEDSSVDYIRNQLKALIARNLFDFSAYVQVVMTGNPAFQEAIRILGDDTFDKMNIKY